MKGVIKVSDRYNQLYGILDKIKFCGMIISGSAIFIMMVYTSTDVLLRNLFNFSSLNTYEFSQNYFMPMAVFPALAYAYGNGIMPRIELLITKVKDIYQRIVAVCIYGVEAVLFTLLSFYGLKYTLNSIQEVISFSAGGTNYPVWPVLIFVPVSFLLIAIESVFLLIKNVRNKKASFTVKENDDNEKEKGVSIT